MKTSRKMNRRCVAGILMMSSPSGTLLSPFHIILQSYQFPLRPSLGPYPSQLVPHRSQIVPCQSTGISCSSPPMYSSMEDKIIDLDESAQSNYKVFLQYKNGRINVCCLIEQGTFAFPSYEIQVWQYTFMSIHLHTGIVQHLSGKFYTFIGASLLQQKELSDINDQSLYMCPNTWSSTNAHLPTDFPHCGQNQPLVYVVSGDNIVECLMLKSTAFISTSATQSQIHNRTLDKPTCDELLLCQHSAILFQQPTLITYDIETAKKILQNGLLIIAKKMILELHLKLKWSKKVLTQVQIDCLLPITIGACVSPAKPHKRDDSSLSMCSCLSDTVHVREELTKKENSKIVLEAFQDANMTPIHIYCLLCFHSRQNQIMCTYMYLNQNLNNIKSRMIQAITPLPPSVDIAQQLSSRTGVSGSLRLCNNLYHRSQHQSLMLTVNENDLDKSLALESRAADSHISTLHNKCSQLSNKRLDHRLLFGHFADHNFVPNPVAGNMTMKITPALSSKSTMSVAKQAQPLHPLSSSQPVNVLPFLPTVTNHEEKSKLASVQDNKGNCSCTESSMDKNKNEKSDTDRDKSDKSGRGDLEVRRGNDGENRDCNSDNEGEGYLGEEEDSANNEESERERTKRKCHGRKKRKKKRRSSTKKKLRRFQYVDQPIALVRGRDDNRPEKETNPPTSQAQQETNHHPPLTVQVVDGVTVHTRICPSLQPRENQQPVRAHFIPQVQQQPYHHSHLLQTQQEQEVNPNSSLAATPSVPTKETCHQCTSATAHGSVLVQPQVVHPPRVTIETQTEGTIIIVPQPLANVSPSSAIDSGLGTTNLTSSGHQSHPLPQNNHFQHVSTPARQRRSENSSINEPRWNYATAHVGAPIMNDNHDSIQSHDFSHYVQVGTTDDEMQNGPHANEPLQANNNEQVNQGQEDTEWNYANTIARGYESAEEEEGECLPTHSAIIAIPHGGQRRPRLQFAAISPQQNSSSSGAAHGANLSPLNLVTASLPPVVSSFGTLMEASIEPLIHLPNEVRPMPVVHGVSQAYQPHPRPGNPPVPTLPHTQGVMMFGALEQPADDEQLVGVPGPVVNNVLPRQNAVNVHIPSMIHSSTPQAGNSLSFHALVEDSQPRELFTVL